jgi:hypothetical protein
MMLTLEGASVVLGIATKCHLRSPPIQDFDNILVCNIAHLIVLMYDLSVPVANSSLVVWHQCITRLILGANVAVDARPSLFAFAVVALSHGPITVIIC